MKKRIFAMVFLLFAMLLTPWLHALMVLNFEVAIPSFNPNEIHGFVWGMQGIVGLAYVVWAVNDAWHSR